MNKMNLASETSKALNLVRKRENPQSLSKTKLSIQQALFYHNIKSGSIELVNSGGMEL